MCDEHEELLKKQLEGAWTFYENHVNAIVATQFKHVKTFCEARNFIFVSGMGTWFIGTGSVGLTTRQLSELGDDGKRIAMILKMEVPGHDYPLGTMMPDFRPE